MGIPFCSKETTVNGMSIVKRPNENQMIRKIATLDFSTIDSGRWFDQRIFFVVIPSHLLIPWLDKTVIAKQETKQRNCKANFL